MSCHRRLLAIPILPPIPKHHLQPRHLRIAHALQANHAHRHKLPQPAGQVAAPEGPHAAAFAEQVVHPLAAEGVVGQVGGVAGRVQGEVGGGDEELPGAGFEAGGAVADGDSILEIE